MTAALDRPPRRQHRRAPTCPSTPTSCGATRSRRSSYDVVIVGGGGHGLATAYYLAKNHGITNVAVLEKGWLAGGNMARNTTHHPVQLPVGRERRHLRALAQAVGGPRGRPRLPDPVQPARRAQPRAQPAGRPRQRAPGRGQQAQRHRRRVARRRTRSRRSARSSTSRRTSATRCWARPTSRARASPSTTTSPGASPGAPTQAGRRPDPGLRGHRLRHRRRTGSPACGRPAATSPPGQVVAVRGRAHLGAGRHGRPARCRCRATRCRRWSPSCSSRCTRRRHVERRARLRLPGAQGRAGDGRRRRRLQRLRPARRVPHHRAADGRRGGAVPGLRPGAPAADLGRRSSTSRPDASPIVGRTPFEDLYLNCGWGTGGFKATPGVGWCFAAHDRPRRAAPATSRRSPSTASSPARSSTSTAPPPWRTEPPESGFQCNSSHARGAGPARRSSSTTAARRTSPTRRTRPRCPTRSGPSTCSSATTPKGLFAERWMPRRRLPPLVQRDPRHRHLPLPARLPPRRAEAGDLMSEIERRRGAVPAADRRPDRPRRHPPVHLRRTDAHRPPRRHPGLGAARQRRAPDRPPASSWAGPAASRRPGRRTRTPGAGRGAVPRADAAGHHRRAVRRARRRTACPARAGSPTCRTPPATTPRHAHADVLVVGAGPAGLTAALTAARAGARVVLVDEQSEAGRLAAGHRRPHRRRAGAGVGPARPPPSWPASPTCCTCSAPPRSGTYDDGFVLALERRTDHLGLPHRRTCPGSGSGASGPAASSSRPGRTSARSCSPTTTVPASCSPAAPAPTCTATACWPAARPSCSPPTTAPTPPRSTSPTPACEVRASSTRGRSRPAQWAGRARAAASRSAPGRSSPARTASSG